MALSVGTELAALLLGANGAEAGARRAPGGAAAAQPGADALPGFADLLAAATNGEPGLTPAPAPTPQPGVEDAAAVPAARPKVAVAAAMPWDALAAAAEEADTLAAPFQWPGSAQPGPATVPEAPAAHAEEAEAPAEPAIPVAAAVLVMPLQPPFPLMPVAAPMAAAASAKPQEQAVPPTLPPMAEALPQQPPADAPPLPAAAPSTPAKKPGLGKQAETVPLAAVPASAPVASELPVETPPAAPPLAAIPIMPVQDASTAVVAAAAIAPVAPRPAEAKHGESANTSAQRPEGPTDPSIPLPLQPVDSSDPAPLAMSWKDAVSATRDTEAKSPIAAVVAAAAEADRPSTPPPVLSFEVQRPAEAFRPVAATVAAPLVLRPHQMAEAGQQVVLRASQAATEGVETISVDLRPPELGRVELRLTFRDGAVQVSMTAERVETYEAFRHDRANLEQQMQQAGIQLGSGGLDLQHGRLPPREGEPERRIAQTAELVGEDGGDDALAPLRPRSDSLIDLIA
jgi:flagellar hook-length control protein FliK